MISPASEQTRKHRSLRALLLGITLLMFLIAVGFKGGWLAVHRDTRPVGKLRPGDLVASSSVPSDPSTTPGLPGLHSETSIPEHGGDRTKGNDHDHDQDDD